jgi:hypothetical protein
MIMDDLLTAAKNGTLTAKELELCQKYVKEAQDSMDKVYELLILKTDGKEDMYVDDAIDSLAKLTGYFEGLSSLTR